MQNNYYYYYYYNYKLFTELKYCSKTMQVAASVDPGLISLQRITPIFCH